MTEEYFVKAVYQSKEDKGLCAVLKRADSTALNFRCCEFLLRHGVNIENEKDRQIASVISASIARSKFLTDGLLNLSKALTMCYPDGKESSAARMKMRKLCSCDSLEELLKALRPILRLIDSKDINLNHIELYQDLQSFRFENRRDFIKARWMKQFFSDK